MQARHPGGQGTAVKAVARRVDSIRSSRALAQRELSKKNQEGKSNMHFQDKKVIVVGGSAGMGRQIAIDVVDHGGSAVIVGRSKSRVDDTVAELTNRGGEAGASPPS